jgi:S1-C subfamily serine protease
MKNSHPLGSPRIRNVSLPRWYAKFLSIAACAGSLWLASRASAQDMKPATLERVKKATVMVFTAESRSSKGDTQLGSGSGFFINSTGLCVTNNHVIDPTHGMLDERQRQAWYYEHGTLTFTVVVDAGADDEQTYECNSLYQSRTGDQALLQCMDKEGKRLRTPNYLRFLPESRLRTDMKAWALGFPGGDSQRSAGVGDKHPAVTVTRGNVLDLRFSPGGRLLIIYTDVTANRGNSGGPMVDIDGFLLGAVTLKDKPEDREDTGGANYSALSPNTLTRDMLRYAFTLKKIPDGTDFTPFIEILINDEGRIDIPEYRRQRDQDVMFYNNGDRIYGEVGTSSVKWDSPLGTVDIPTDAIAYVMKTDEGASVFLEGGNRLVSTQSDYKFKFKPRGGSETEHALSDVAAVGFKTKGRRIESVKGKVVVFDSDLSHLVLSDVQGGLKFSSSAGPISLNLEDILRIETTLEGDKQILTLNDDRRLTGKFGPEPIKARIAAVGTPITFSLENVSNATVETRRLSGDSAGGLDLPGVLSKADADVRRVARLLEFGDVKTARLRLTEMGSPETLRSLTTSRRDQVTLLDAVASLQEGQYEKAKKSFRAVAKSSDPNIAAYASACSDVLKKYDTQFDGKSLSDRAVFTAAGTALARDYVRDVRTAIRDARRYTGERRADYTNTINLMRRHEPNMNVAAVFVGPEADDELIRLIKLVIDASLREIGRLEQAIQESEEGGRGGARGGATAAVRRTPREIQEMRQQREDAMKALEPLGLRYYRDYGFRIEDQDIQALREQRSPSFDDE